MTLLLDTEPTMLESLDLTPTCDWVDPSCETVSTWEAVASCGCLWLLCDSHQMESERRMGFHFVTVVCTDCGTPLSRVEFRRMP